MLLSDRLLQPSPREPAPPPDPRANGSEPVRFAAVKDELHRRLVDTLDLKNIERLSPERVREEIRALLASMVGASKIPLNQFERDRLIQDLLDEVTGLGPLEAL